MSESLAGRMQILTLWPLSQGEIEGRRETFLESVYGPDLPSSSPAASETGLARRVARGGSWSGEPFIAHAAYRFRPEPAFTHSYLGFRCAKSAP